jgi:hypothetical protein
VFLVGFPLLLIAIAIYAVIAFLMPGVSWTEPLTSVRMISGAEWSMTLSDILIAFSLLLLFFEILKATRTGQKSIMDHILSMLVFVLALVGFLLLPQAATSTFVIIMLICLVDVVAGFSITIRTAQRDWQVERAEP